MNHVDPETLAAWADGTLSSGEATVVESHLADCPPCRAVSAAFARTIEPAATAAAVTAPTRSASSLTKWVLPFAATIVIAAGVAWQLWPRAEKAEEPVQRASAETAAQPAPLPQAEQPVAPPVTAAPPARTAPAATTKPKVDLRPKGASNAVAALPAPTSMPAPPQPAAIPSPPPPPILQMAPPIGQTQAAATRITASAGAAAESVSAADRWKAIDFVSLANVPFANVGGGAGRGGNVRASITSTGQVRWRATGPNTVERSRDGSVTWVPVEIEALAVVLTAGAAPSPEVCWLVGRAGAVLLSTNGGPFKRVAFPESADLASVTAVSDLQATVITADGRGFVTADGGKTWRARF